MLYKVIKQDKGYLVVNTKTMCTQSCWDLEIDAKDTANRLNKIGK